MKPFLTTVFVACLAVFARTQNVDFYGNALGKDICNTYGMKDDKDAKECLDKICDAADIPNNFLLAPCPNIDNCFALYKNGYSYIVYDINFFNKIKTYGFTEKNLPNGAVDWAALTILAHEIGHHMCLHTTNPNLASLYTPVQIELQADEYAGTILYRLGATLAQAQQAMYSKDIADEATLTHPARTDRLAAIKKGWEKEYAKYTKEWQPGGLGAPTQQAQPATLAATDNETKSLLHEADAYMHSRYYDTAWAIYKNFDSTQLDGQAMVNIGWMYMNGRGVERDYAKAKEWLVKAANASNAAAMVNLGILHKQGLGVDKDSIKAEVWFNKAKAAYEKAATTGDGYAMARLGWMYDAGMGVARDSIKAQVWYEKGAKAGNAEAMEDLGRLYLNGRGMAKDYLKAKEWFEKAANAGNGLAMFDLGHMYYEGLGVAEDFTKAAEWYEKAANAGEIMPLFLLGIMYEGGLGVAKDYANAIKLYQKAASVGFVAALIRLGDLYGQGNGVEKDYIKAIGFYEKAGGYRQSVCHEQDWAFI